MTSNWGSSSTTETRLSRSGAASLPRQSLASGISFNEGQLPPSRWPNHRRRTAPAITLSLMPHDPFAPQLDLSFDELHPTRRIWPVRELVSQVREFVEE